MDPQRNADNLKAASDDLGVDAAGLCAVPEWAHCSHIHSLTSLGKVVRGLLQGVIGRVMDFEDGRGAVM